MAIREFLIILIANMVFALEELVPDNIELPQDANAHPLLTRSLYLNLNQYPGELCNRVCVAGEIRACYFKFFLEHYQAMGVACRNCSRGVEEACDHPQCIVGDGIEKGVMSINRQIPGPAIQVCKNDLIVVDVTNHAHGTAAAIHWHGLHMRDTPFMDGVPFVTQCPILYATTFRYSFEATEPGTQFYHSHSGHHKINGQYGALIIRDAEDPQSMHYDEDLPEHYLLLSDWQHHYGETFFPGLPHWGGIWPDSLLINGRGVFINPKRGEYSSAPPRKFFVNAGKTYRLRIINSISHACPVKLQIEQHDLTVIASDGFNVEPRRFNTLIINAGERYDVVLSANQQIGDYWIRLRGMGLCAQKPLEAFAILRYGNKDDDLIKTQRDLPKYKETYADGVLLNHPNASCINGIAESLCISKLRALDADEELINATPDYRFDLAFHNYPVPKSELFQPTYYPHFINPRGDVTLVGGINNLSMVFPDYPPLTQTRDIDESVFCDESTWPAHCENKRLCACVHRLFVRRGSIVEFLIVDQTEEVNPMHHPFHLHGFRFMVTELGQHPLGVPMTIAMAKDLERRRLLRSSFSNNRPIWKDTVSVPSCGFALVRFRADNPGFWLLHCHYEWHVAVGMGLVLQVGRPIQMVNAPSSFPECKNYLPNVRRPRGL